MGKNMENSPSFQGHEYTMIMSRNAPNKTEKCGMVMSLSQVNHTSKGLKELKRYRLVLIDKSHNLRNREGRRNKAIAENLSSEELDYINQLRHQIPHGSEWRGGGRR